MLAVDIIINKLQGIELSLIEILTDDSKSPLL